MFGEEFDEEMHEQMEQVEIDIRHDNKIIFNSFMIVLIVLIWLSWHVIKIALKIVIWMIKKTFTLSVRLIKYLTNRHYYLKSIHNAQRNVVNNSEQQRSQFITHNYHYSNNNGNFNKYME